MTEIPSKLDRLLGYLVQDPQNLNLLQDAAAAAYEEGRLSVVAELAARAETFTAPSPTLLNLAGLAALRASDLAQAEACFSRALQQDPANPDIRGNLAWTRAVLKDWASACDLIDEAVIAAQPRAAALKVEAFQHLGRPEDALAWADRLAERSALPAAALSALSMAALDAEQPQRARSYAEAAGDTPEAASTLAFLALQDGDSVDAESLLDRALAHAPHQPRALLGKGLARLSANDPQTAAAWLDEAAKGFETHLGSWIAAGWAYFAAGDLTQSRQRFATALALDDSFAESHGALAVIDLLEGRRDAARRGVNVALRLDQRCFGALLGKMLLAQSEGDVVSAERIRAMAMTLPIGVDGLTLAAALTRFRR